MPNYGRPPRRPSPTDPARRSERLVVLLTPAELGQVQVAADAGGQPASSYVRDVLLEAMLAKSDLDLAKDLRRLAAEMLDRRFSMDALRAILEEGADERLGG